MQYFKTVQLYFKSIINSFDILALSEHCLFEEQHSLLKTATDGAYNYHAASSCDNPCIASGQRAHGRVALLWRYSIDDFVTPIENIDSDRIVGIKVIRFDPLAPVKTTVLLLPIEWKMPDFINNIE